MNESDLNCSLSVHISSSQHIFNVLQRPNLEKRFVLSKVVLFDCKMIAFFVDERRSENQFVSNYGQLTCTDCESVNEMNFFEGKDHLKFFSNFILREPVQFWLSNW